MKRLSTILASLVLVTGCMADQEQSNTGGELALNLSESQATGTYTLGDAELAFTSSEIEPGVFDVTVQLDGMMLTAVLDRDNNVSELDGFATSNGSNTALTAEDRDVLSSFVKDLELQIDRDAFGADDVLYRVSSLWAQTSDSMPLQRGVIGEANRSYTSICSKYQTWQYATHDDNNYNQWDPHSTDIGYVGYRWDNDTHYSVNGSWTTAVQDHSSDYTYEAGDCYANCGAGCPSGNQQLTWDCHDHDQCVRNGHSIASFWCDDEFTSASDDELFAPTCPGT